MKGLLGISVLAAAVITLFLVMAGYGVVKDTDALIDQAQVAADREDMTEYLAELKNNMEKRGMTRGHFALIFTTPANDLALHFKTVNRILERLHSIKDISKSETAYQVALDDIRGTIRELRNPALGFLFTQYWVLYIIGGISWIAVFVFGGIVLDDL